jgi:hypothetical protein
MAARSRLGGICRGERIAHAVSEVVDMRAAQGPASGHEITRRIARHCAPGRARQDSAGGVDRRRTKRLAFGRTVAGRRSWQAGHALMPITLRVLGAGVHATGRLNGARVEAYGRLRASLGRARIAPPRHRAQHGCALHFINGCALAAAPDEGGGARDARRCAGALQWV